MWSRLRLDVLVVERGEPKIVVAAQFGLSRQSCPGINPG